MSADAVPEHFDSWAQAVGSTHWHKLPNELVRNGLGLDHVPQRVLMVLLSWVNDWNLPSHTISRKGGIRQPNLATWSGASLAQVKRSLLTLKARGFITVVPCGRGRPCVYIVHLDAIANALPVSNGWKPAAERKPVARRDRGSDDYEAPVRRGPPPRPGKNNNHPGRWRYHKKTGLQEYVLYNLKEGSCKKCGEHLAEKAGGLRGVKPYCFGCIDDIPIPKGSQKKAPVIYAEAGVESSKDFVGDMLERLNAIGEPRGGEAQREAAAV